MVVTAAVVTTSVILINRYFLPPTGIDWQFPQNSTVSLDYVKVPYSVKMIDNVRLATDVYFPKELNEALPVIFIRTPYDKDSMNILISYTQEGYIVIMQDFRGFYDSEGDKTLPFVTEQADGQASLMWITEQPWCNGNIGTWGPSALGIAQYLMAPNAPDSLKCQLPLVATPNAYEAGFRGGELRRELLVPWMQASGFPTESFDTFQENERYNSIWEPANIQNNYSSIHAASLHVGGWFDIFTQNTIEAFLGYQYSSGLGAQGNAKLIMGPWVHGGMLGAPSGPPSYVFPNQSLSIMYDVNEALFGKWLKNNSTMWDKFPAISYYLMSSLPYSSELANQWFQAEDWPIPSTPYDFYMHSNLSLSENPSSEVDGSISYLYDPNNPVETIGGGNLAIEAGVYDQSSLEVRDDVLSFTSDILEDTLIVVGQMEVTLYISSNCTDTDFTVKITDVLPDNRSLLVTDTIIRARNRNSVSEWEFLNPGEVYEITIPLDSTAYLFNEGHRFRVDVSSSNFERFETNPNTGESLWSNTTTFVANNSIYLNSINASKITLPSVEYNSLTPFDLVNLQPSFEPYPMKEEVLNEATLIEMWIPVTKVIVRR